MSLKALSAAKTYLNLNYDISDAKKIENELSIIGKIDVSAVETTGKAYSYDSLQSELATLNEKSNARKLNGSYYTPADVVEFILLNSVKFFYNELGSSRLNNFPLETLPQEKFCYECTLFDPTCGAGVFLLAALELKFKLLEKFSSDLDSKNIRRVVGTIFGNDLNADSILIAKLKIFLCVLHRYGINYAAGLAEILNQNFFRYDFVGDGNYISAKKYDIIVGNPPYVEDSKLPASDFKKYGNIYANVLSNSAALLNSNGVMGFIVPLSYVATPRMKKLRAELFRRLPQQYILSFADRPDSLFVSVHQKLCILFAGNKGGNLEVFTSNYQYRYKTEREKFFECVEVVANHFLTEDFIPKLGSPLETRIYRKIISNSNSLKDLFVPCGVPIYLNMRATYWIKAFSREHAGAEYKIFHCENAENANLIVLLLNSSLFWWYWVCVSDCWHITNKELAGFKLPKNFNPQHAKDLIDALENRLESTKMYVGTRQTEYEYKHKFCAEEIHKIDDYVNWLYGLDAAENAYIKNFAYRYRTGGGGIKF